MIFRSAMRLILVVFISIFCMGFSTLKEHLLTGDTMGTTYHIKIIAPQSDDMAAVQTKIDDRLNQLNQSMSTYLKESEINRFNKSAAGRSFAVSNDFSKVMLAADAIYELTDGAWDGTVNPLVDMWGFGRSGSIQKVPSSAAIRDALEAVGFKHIEVSAEGYLRKLQSQVTVNLASIAKGYGVDVVAQLIDGLGYQNYLVEIGGEVFAAGRRHDGKLWKVGVNRPEKGGSATAVYVTVNLADRAMATSGDYRHYVDIGGRTYSHIIDPRTGYPVDNGVVSASVITTNCTLADGLATALMIMGASNGIALLDRTEKVEGLIIARQPDGTLRDYRSKGMADMCGSP